MKLPQLLFLEGSIIGYKIGFLSRFTFDLGKLFKAAK